MFNDLGDSEASFILLTEAAIKLRPYLALKNHERALVGLLSELPLAIGDRGTLGVAVVKPQ